MPHLKRITNRDASALLAAVAVLYSDVNQQTLADRTVKAIATVISSDITSFDSWEAGAYRGKSWGNIDLNFQPEHLEIFSAFIHENPIFTESVLQKRPDAVMLSDFMPLRQFYRTRIFNEFYRRLGEADTQMAIAMPISSDSHITCQMNRAGRDFSERDRSVLNLIAPHLINAIRNAFAFERLSSALETMESGVIAIDADGKTQFISNFARQSLNHYFPDQKLADNSLPEVLWAWVTHSLSLKKQFAGPIEPFRISAGQGALTIRLLENRQTTEETLLLEERKVLSAELLKARLPLTKRESEVLFWISTGKSDPEIAIIFGISPHTVHKHAQNIYVKLGVETRTAALITARDVL